MGHIAAGSREVSNSTILERWFMSDERGGTVGHGQLEQVVWQVATELSRGNHSVLRQQQRVPIPTPVASLTGTLTTAISSSKDARGT